ncbi:hypothetical protein [Pseudomonas viridiflava]|uniref:hypothetical protein n=1 Tax=Pseudomonas viridiflava TaxID=33069 RepID=UPI000F0650D5|nr:hypothetical protein [Pseudomonas viridiflava]
MHLIDRYLPDYQFSETHWLETAASPARLMTEAVKYRPEDDRFFRYAIQLRELPMRLFQRSASSSKASFGMDNFTLLHRDGDTEVVYGLAGKFWQADYGQAHLADGEAFQHFAEPGSVKLAISFTCQRLESGLARMTTHTRVHCVDRQALRRFTPYWYAIRPVSGMIRRRMLQAIARRSLESGH